MSTIEDYDPFKCKCCDVKFDNNTFYQRHLLTNKHKRNSEEYNYIFVK